MLESVMQAFTGLFDRRALVSTFLPSFTAWAIVLATVLLGELGWTRALAEWDGLGGTAQLVLGVAFVAGVTFWTFVCAALRTAVVQLYEGYWSARRPVGWVGKALSARKVGRVRALRKRDAALEAEEREPLAELRAWADFDAGRGGASAAGSGEAELVAALNALPKADPGERSRGLRAWAVRVRDASPQEAYGDASVRSLTAAIEQARAEQQRLADAAARDRNALAHELFLRFPPLESQVMPTRLGNILRAAEEHPRTAYGLDTAVVWPRLLPVLPAEAVELSQNARTPFDLLITVSWFTALFGLPLSVYTWLGGPAWSWPAALALGAGVVGVSYGMYRVATYAAVAYGEALKAVIDLHRLKVLEAMGVPLPAGAADERRVWGNVSRLLYRGDPLP